MFRVLFNVKIKLYVEVLQLSIRGVTTQSTYDPVQYTIQEDKWFGALTILPI